MRKEAKEFGLDLDDPKVREALKVIQKEKMEKGVGGEGGKVAGKGDTKDRGRTGWMKAVVVVSVAVGVYYLWPWLSSTEEDLY